MSVIYIRTLKRAENTVFCVQDKQKTYYDPLFRKMVPYSSGQQVKRSILDALNQALDLPGSPMTFHWEINEKNEFKEGEAYCSCDPSHADQLFGGWMLATKWSKEKPLKRRSPLSISSMRAIHPLLARVHKEDLTLNRTHRPNNKIIIRDAKGAILTEKQAQSILKEKKISATRKWIPENTRATGIFVQDVAIDLTRLFSVSLNRYEPEIDASTEKRLRQNGWIETNNHYGDCLVSPKQLRNKWISVLSDAIIGWRITSNQSANFHLMETLAMTISDNANKIPMSIRARYQGEEKVDIIVEESLPGVDTFITPASEACFLSETGSIDALDRARERIVQLLKGFDYEKQQSRKK